MRVVLGNRHAVDSTDNGETRKPLPKGKRATLIEPDDGTPLSEVFTAITHPAGIWATHAREGATPAWVASDSPGLASLLAEHFGGIEVRELEVAGCCGDPTPTAVESGGEVVAAICANCLTRLSLDMLPKRRGGGTGGSAKAAPLMLMLALQVLALGWLLTRMSPFLKTNAGNDFQAAQMGGAASATAVAKWVALTANTTAPAAGDTTLTAEIATAGGGLIRKAGTYAHTTGAASYTITTVFTANGSDALPVTIGKRGIFDAASAGNMVFETLVSPTATLSASGDSLTLTDTISL